ncbi:hypothetical protein TNCT_302601 [Trichonephila clavata]|uniref:Uncharacterized protein n=1 Tax=Trichonephila clavata TaxID=2740835 RepID=A0A8X6IN38_TRICU|nr:hypothetical protein TNCT_302601 [Trichonephila clavata]
MNAKYRYWNPHTRINQAGTVIFKFCNRVGISIHAPTKQTRFDAHGVNTTLVIALAKGLHSITSTSISKHTSDHNPVNFDISFNSFSSPPPPLPAPSRTGIIFKPYSPGLSPGTQPFQMKRTYSDPSPTSTIESRKPSM